MSPDLTDEEVDRICDGYVQNAARVRFLKRLGLHVQRKPNGRPLVNRKHYDAVTSGQAQAPGIKSSGRQPAWSVAS